MSTKLVVVRETLAAKMYLARDAELNPVWTNDRDRAWEMDEAGAIFLANIRCGTVEDIHGNPVNHRVD